MKLSTKLLIHGLANIVIATGVMALLVLYVVYQGSFEQIDRLNSTTTRMVNKQAAALGQAKPDQLWLDDLATFSGGHVILWQRGQVQGQSASSTALPDNLVQLLHRGNVAAQLPARYTDDGLKFYTVPFWPSWPLHDTSFAMIVPTAAGDVVILRPADVVLKMFVDLFSMFSVLGVVGAALSGLGLFWSVRVSLRPLIDMTAAMKELAAGKLDIHVPAQNRRDEIGGMAQAVCVFKENAIEQHSLKQRQQQLEQEAKQQHKRLLHELAGTLDQQVHEVVQKVAQVSSEVDQMSVRVSGSAATVLHENAQVTEQMGRSRESVAQVERAADEMRHSIDEIQRNVENSRTRTAHAVELADQAKTLVDSLQGAASRIGEVVTIISEIAEKTNLLALNATIEAARAGEAGKGFAVVAGEVKQLAGQTAAATREISEQIDGIRQIAQTSATAISDINQSVYETNTATNEIAVSVGSQSQATHHMTGYIGQLIAGTTQVEQNMAEVQQGAGQTSAAAQEMRHVSASLAEQVGHLAKVVDGIVAQLRAA